MSSSLQNLLAQRAALEQEIEAAQKRERQEAIARVKALMSEYGLTLADISPKGTSTKAGVSKGTKVPPKFRNAQTGETWSGRGLQPKWLKAALASGKKIEDFVV